MTYSHVTQFAVDEYRRAVTFKPLPLNSLGPFCLSFQSVFTVAWTL